MKNTVDVADKKFVDATKEGYLEVVHNLMCLTMRLRQLDVVDEYIAESLHSLQTVANELEYHLVELEDEAMFQKLDIDKIEDMWRQR